MVTMTDLLPQQPTLGGLELRVVRSPLRCSAASLNRSPDRAVPVTGAPARTLGGLYARGVRTSWLETGCHPLFGGYRSRWPRWSGDCWWGRNWSAFSASLRSDTHDQRSKDQSVPGYGDSDTSAYWDGREQPGPQTEEEHDHENGEDGYHAPGFAWGRIGTPEVSAALRGPVGDPVYRSGGRLGVADSGHLRVDRGSWRRIPVLIPDLVELGLYVDDPEAATHKRDESRAPGTTTSDLLCLLDASRRVDIRHDRRNQKEQRQHGNTRLNVNRGVEVPQFLVDLEVPDEWVDDSQSEKPASPWVARFFPPLATPLVRPRLGPFLAGTA